MKTFKRRGRKTTKAKRPRRRKPQFEDGLIDSSDPDESKSFAYGKFDVAGLDKWERTFLLARKKDVAEHFEDPTSKGIAHRWVQAELLLEQLRQRATAYYSDENHKGFDTVLAQINKMEKMVQGLQKELNFLPSQTADEKKIEEIFSNMVTAHRMHKAQYVTGFDHEEIELMVAKGMDVELEKVRIAEITGRLARERARALVVVILSVVLEVAREVFGLDDGQSEDLMERLAVRLKSRIAEVLPLVD